VYNPRSQCFSEAKLKLDTGMDKHNLISRRLVEDLELTAFICEQEEDICTCLNGQPLKSTGHITIKWKGKGFLKIFTTLFYVVEEYDPAWEILLSAETIFNERILAFQGFGGRPIITKKRKGKVFALDLYVLDD
jgi:hypothetical protein